MPHIATKTFFLSVLIAILFAAVAKSQSPDFYHFDEEFALIGNDFDAFGREVSGVGDVNGDGYDDLIVGIQSSNVFQNNAGQIKVYSGFDGSIIHDIFGDSAEDFFGFSVSGAGDVNADGFDDFIVGALLDDNGGDSSGTARVFSGVDGSILWTFQGSLGDQMGRSVSEAGDVNGDGYDDVIIGVWLANSSNGIQTGQAQVRSGINGSLLHILHGPSPSAFFGTSVSGAGDVDGDGLDDVIVGAYANSPNGASSGSAYVYSGATGLILHTFNGDTADDFLGWSVSGAGDVNNDGTPDLIVGAPGDDNLGTDGGSARVYSGLTGAVLIHFDGLAGDGAGYSVSDFGDANEDGFAEVLVGAPSSNCGAPSSGAVVVISGATGLVIGGDCGLFNHDLGWSVSGLGDTNNDGRPDFVVSAPQAVFENTIGGLVHVFRTNFVEPLNGTQPNNSFGFSVSGLGDITGDGHPDILVGAPDFAAGKIELYSGIDKAFLMRIEGDNTSDDFGASVSGAGDVNGDGVPDFIVGAFRGDHIFPSAGYARVFSGADGSVLANRGGHSSFDRFGYSVSGAGDVNNDGFADYLVGAPRDDNNGPGSGSVRIFSGATNGLLYAFDGAHAGAEFGTAVSNAGDVNADGFADIIVGAIGENGTSAVAGSATVFSGFDGSVLYKKFGATASSKFGITVSGAGDVNGDGFDDFIVGAPDDDFLSTDNGTVTVFSGADGNVLHSLSGPSIVSNFGISVSDVGDYNGDGFADFIVGADNQQVNGISEVGGAAIYSGASGLILKALYGDSQYDSFGHSVSGLGDVDANGFADVLVGAYRDDNYGSNTGSVTLDLAPTLPTLSYSSDLGFVRLRQTWTPDGGVATATTGTIDCSGATPGGMGVFGLSLAPTNFLIFGFPLLVANDPVNLIDSGQFGYGFVGEIIVPNVSLHNPFLAGSSVYTQFFESSPIPSCSNGLRLTIVP